MDLDQKVHKLPSELTSVFQTLQMYDGSSEQFLFGLSVYLHILICGSLFPSYGCFSENEHFRSWLFSLFNCSRRHLCLISELCSRFFIIKCTHALFAVVRSFILQFPANFALLFFLNVCLVGSVSFLPYCTNYMRRRWRQDFTAPSLLC